MSSPFGPLVLIANPRAGGGRVARMLPALERRLRDAGLPHRVVRTARAGHAAEAAREALRRGERYVVAAGGDGTVHEVVNGLMHDGPAAGAVLGVVAAGSGGDLARTLGLPRDAAGAAARLAGDRTCSLDVGEVAFTGPDGAPVTRYFANVAQVGIGAATAARAAHLPRWLGRWRYVAAFWLVLPRFAAAAVAIDAGADRLEARAHQVVVANARYYGGGMEISPRSRPDDGLLDVLAFVGPKSDAFALVPRVYRGTHLPHPRIAELRARRVRVRSERPWPLEADGEVLGEARDVTVSVLPAALRVKV